MLQYACSSLHTRLNECLDDCAICNDTSEHERECECKRVSVRERVRTCFCVSVSQCASVCVRVLWCVCVRVRETKRESESVCVTNPSTRTLVCGREIVCFRKKVHDEDYCAGVLRLHSVCVQARVQLFANI